MTPSERNKIKRAELALTYVALLGGVIVQRGNRWFCSDAPITSNFPLFMSEATPASAAICWLASKGYVLTDDCQLIR